MGAGRWWLALGVVLTAGCGTSTSTSPSAREQAPVDDLSVHARGSCPDVLPIGQDPGGHGFGIDEPATSSPSLPTPDGAWVCEYVAAGRRGDTAAGTTYGWTLSGDPVDVGDRVPDLAAGLDDLATLDHDRACTAELGPRWLVSTTHDADVTGVVVDGFGCGDARLTDDPFTTPAGESTAPGIVSGVLSAPASLRRAIQAVVGDRARWVDLEHADAALRLPCPESEQRSAALDVPGPGQPDPVSAALPYADGGRLVVSDALTGADGTLLVNVLGVDGTVTRVVRVADHDDGWWPDGYDECR